MFFCEPCRIAKRWPDSMFKSRGPCEVCGQTATCHEVASGVLDNWEKITTSLENSEHYIRRGRPKRKPS